MRTIVTLLLLVVSVSWTYSQSAVRIDHTTALLFDRIPSEYIAEAAQLRMMYRHASVGTTIDGGLNCLQGTKNRCTKYPQYQYDRRSWSFQIRGNSGWYGKIKDFALETRRQIDSFDVFAFKYCYLDGLDMIAEPCGSPLKQDHVTKAWETLRDTMLALESAFPSKKFVWWTIPLTQVGMRCTDELNTRIRNFCHENGKILFDLADIESHDTSGLHQVTSEGYEFAFKPYCGEQKADAQACHPNDFGGSIIAKAFWVMMAQLSGWEPGSSSVPVHLRNTVFSISPNPAVDYIDLMIDGVHADQLDPHNFQIFNSAGIQVSYTAAYLTTQEGLRIYISSFPPGMYLINLGHSKGSFIKQ